MSDVRRCGAHLSCLGSGFNFVLDSAVASRPSSGGATHGGVVGLGMGYQAIVSASSDDPAVVGVPPETPDEVRPSATGLVSGPVDDETNIAAADPGDDEVQATEDAGGEVIGETPDGEPMVEGPNSQ